MNSKRMNIKRMVKGTKRTTFISNRRMKIIIATPITIALTIGSILMRVTSQEARNIRNLIDKHLRRISKSLN